jgi:hypothetical protein
VLKFQGGEKRISYTASYKLKVICRKVWEPCSTKRILEPNVRYWRKQKELLKNAKSDSRAFCGPKAGKSAYFMHADFSAATLGKKSAQITRVNTVYTYILFQF